MRGLKTVAVMAIGLCLLSLANAVRAQLEENNWRLSGTSQAGHYQVFMRPLQSDVPLRNYHRWLLVLKSPDGQPVSGAKVMLDGGMPGHGHGLPSSPTVKAVDDSGRYLIEGMQFNMGGHWVLALQIAHGQTDKIQFDLHLAL